MEIVLDPNKNAYENANAYFENSKKMKKKLEDTKKAIEETKKEIEKEKQMQETKRQQKEKTVQMVQNKEKKEWYEQYHWFLTSENILAVGGKNAGQNEELVKRKFFENDLFFHADIKGASVVILKEGKSAGEKSKEETAQFAACYSTAWKAGYSIVDVYYVTKDQVSKSPPPGEYLEKGSFFISGKKNYFRSIPLRLFIGITKEGKLLCVPEKYGEEVFKTYYLIEPGKYSKEIAAEKISRQLNADKEEVGKLIPTGNTSFTRMR